MKNWTRRENEASVHMLPLQTFLLKTCFTLWFCTAMVSGGLCRNNHQSGIIPDHSIPVSSHHPPFKRSQKRKWRMILAEIRGNFLWKGEQNYLGLKHGRAINSSVLGRMLGSSRRYSPLVLDIYGPLKTAKVLGVEIRWVENIFLFPKTGFTPLRNLSPHSLSLHNLLGI